MTTIIAPELYTRSTTLDARREDIRFWNIARDRVRIEVAVHNRSTVRSEPTTMLIQSAPLGAFLPWRPLAQLTVPAIGPGGSAELRIDAVRTPAAPLGEASRIQPARLLTAIGTDDADDIGTAARDLPGLVARLMGQQIDRQAGSMATSLAPNVFELIGRETQYWAGNINVFIGQRSVERHMAQALRVYPGRTNLAIFFVGTRPDAYSFGFSETPLAEYASLVAGARSRSLLQAGEAGDAIPLGQWLETPGRMPVMLVVRLPASCDGGSLEVHVTQRSTGKDAIVEFSTDAHAAGAGCYVV